jgi:hypothetical protein
MDAAKAPRHRPRSGARLLSAEVVNMKKTQITYDAFHGHEHTRAIGLRLRENIHIAVLAMMQRPCTLRGRPGQNGQFLTG